MVLVGEEVASLQDEGGGRMRSPSIISLSWGGEGGGGRSSFV